ncbi:ScbA/BarX family gamma-butyrolactone biosynthesis protein [Actinokineospora sp. NBRC 105648]|uniref:ScbA/BarX family gamma-butyrolactone biosynthesis protein n=1 Tax=Actinokineospora sp. NBRC 105648 TaxID=3032206 RepID=UPI0025556AAE|nr:ScbA/BarX family gamma-butyrolactone biosynthesis protein [Actinokineospora sp. NBRC 105648]
MYEQTVPRHLVHRSAVSEVFLTGFQQVGVDTFHVAAQWPRAHTFFGPRNPTTHDPLLFVETIRQAGLLVAHRGLAVPLDHRFLSHHKTYDIDPEGLVVGRRPTDVLLVVTVPAGPPAQARRMMRFSCHRDGELVATAAVQWSCLSDGSYRRVRGDRITCGQTPTEPAAGPVPPRSVGRVRAEDVVLTPTPVDRAWSLRVDTRHPVMFDHPTDHVPGMVAVEAARQAAMLTMGTPDALPVAARFGFHRFIEYDEPCVVAADPPVVVDHDRTEVAVRLTQGRDVAVDGVLTLVRHD